MEIVIKITPESYHRLRRQVPSGSPAHERIEKAARIDHAVEGVEFAGYSISCTKEQARVMRDAAKQSCPEVVTEIDKALNAARSR
jgi:hypothetical protein